MHDVAAVDVVVQGLLNEILRFVARQLRHPRVQEDELQVQAGAKHEHVAMKFDLGDGAGRQGVTHGHQTHVLEAAVERRRVQGELLHLQIAGAVDHLWKPHSIH